MQKRIFLGQTSFLKCGTPLKRRRTTNFFYWPKPQLCAIFPSPDGGKTSFRPTLDPKTSQKQLKKPKLGRKDVGPWLALQIRYSASWPSKLGHLSFPPGPQVPTTPPTTKNPSFSSQFLVQNRLPNLKTGLIKNVVGWGCESWSTMCNIPPP